MLYRDNVPEQVEPYVHVDRSLIQQLVDDGSLVPVDEWCRVHYRESNPGRGFCDAGTESDIGGWYEWDCDIVYLLPKEDN